MAVFDAINDGPLEDIPGGLPGALGVDTKNAALYVGTADGWSSVGGPGGVGAEITAAATITPTNSVHELTGATAVETITPPPNFPAGATITLIPMAASGQATGTSGNIALATTLVQYKALILTWSGTAWYPSY
jgi:hypothetical protein